MKLLTIPFLVAMAWAQTPALYIDLSEAWRASDGDSPEMAAPAYDDSAWRITPMPPRDQSSRGAGWLRKRVDLPLWADRSRLAITLGGFERIYAVYVNGVLIGQTGGFESRSDVTLNRTRSFKIPEEALAPSGGSVLIAVRYLRFTGGGFRLRIPDAGPYALTDWAGAPWQAGTDQIRLHRARFTPELVIAGACLVLALFVLAAWWRNRERKDLFWLAMYLLSAWFHTTWSVLGIDVDRHSFNAGGVPSISVIALAATWAFFATFVLAVTQVPWRWLLALPWGFWLLWAAAAAGPGSFSLFRSVGVVSGAVSVLALLWAGQELWANTRRTWSQALLLATLLLPAVDRLRLNLFENVDSYLSVGDAYSILTERVFMCVWLLPVVFLLLRQDFIDQRVRQRLQGELEAARTVQVLLLPALTPSHVDAVYLPAQEVGGDFWHCYDDRLIVVGDVSGKGLKSAMIVSMVTGALANPRSDSPAAVLAELNTVLLGKPGFVTCCIVRLEKDGRVTVANAGHPAPYLNGQELDVAPGLPLGVAPEADYSETVFAFDGPLTLVSDGVIEAANASGELFGFDRTREISTQSAQAIADAAKNWGQNDDITVVTVRRNG